MEASHSSHLLQGGLADTVIEDVKRIKLLFSELLHVKEHLGEIGCLLNLEGHCIFLAANPFHIMATSSRKARRGSYAVR